MLWQLREKYLNNIKNYPVNNNYDDEEDTIFSVKKFRKYSLRTFELAKKLSKSFKFRKQQKNILCLNSF